MYTVDTPYGYSIKFIEGQDRLFSEGELVHAYSSFERLCESPSQKEYFNAYAEDYGCMYNADDVYNVLYDVQMSIANPQFRKSAKKKVKKSDDVGKGLKKYEQYIPDMTERYPEGRRPVGGDDEPNPPSEKRLWEGDADMDFIREVLNYGEFIDTYETPVSMAYHFRYNGKGYYIINEYAHVDSYGEIIPAMVLEKSVKKKVKKDGGAMGVGDAGATNAVYGAKPTSLTNPDKKYGKKKKTKKEFTDDGNIHGPKPTKTPKAKSR